MFSGKREKALLEEELAALRETEKRERELLHKIAGQKDTAEEQFARMTASRAQMEKEIEEIEQQMQQNGELSENGAQAAGELHNTLITMNNGIATFDANHSVFMEQVKGQNEKVVEIVENNKHFTTPMREVAEKIYERHTTLSSWLVMLGVDPRIAAEDACKIEHDVSAESFEAIKRHINSVSK